MSNPRHSAPDEPVVALSRAMAQKEDAMTDAKDLVLGFYKEVFENRNPAAIEDLVAADCVEHTPMPGQPQGITGAYWIADAFLKAFSNISIVVDDVIAEDDRCAVRNTFTGTHTGEFMGAPATNKRITIPNVDIVVAHNGKVTDHWAYMDTAAVMVDLGLLPAMG